MRGLSDRVVAVFACESGFAAGGRMIEIKGLVFVATRRRDRKIGVSPPIGRGQHFVEDSLALPIDRQIAPDFGAALGKIARVETNGILSGQITPAIPSKL